MVACTTPERHVNPGEGVCASCEHICNCGHTHDEHDGPKRWACEKCECPLFIVTRDRRSFNADEEAFAKDLYEWLWKHIITITTDPEKHFSQEQTQRMRDPKMLARAAKLTARAFYTTNIDEVTKEEAKEAVLNHTMPNRKDEAVF